MRIGIIGPIAWRTPPLHYGGWELVSHYLTEGLVKRGHDVTLFATADSLTGAHLEAICPRPLNEDSKLHARVFETLHLARAYEMAHEFDIFHNHTGSYAMTFTRLTKTPTVTTLHGSGAEPHSRIIYGLYKEQPYVSISNSERALVPELNYLATVYNGIEPSSIPFSEKPGDYLLVIGRLSPDKGIHLAIEVANRCGIPLILAGIVPPENRDYYEAEIKPKLKKGLVEYIGPVSQREKGELFSGAFAYLHLITYSEAFGLTIAESMASGTPVIGIGLGSVPELVKEGLSGYIIPPAMQDKIIVENVDEALTKVTRLDRIAIREYASIAFNADRMVEGYLEVYNKVVNKAW